MNTSGDVAAPLWVPAWRAKEYISSDSHNMLNISRQINGRGRCKLNLRIYNIILSWEFWEKE